MFGILFFILILAASVCVNIFFQMGDITENILREYASVSRLRLSKTDIYSVTDRLTKDKHIDFTNIEHVDDIRFLKYNFNTDFLKDNVSKLLITSDSFNINTSVFILGYNMSLLHLVQEDFNLENGRMFENDSECVISKNFKSINEKWNEIDLGDKITIENDDGIYKEFTVVGIQAQNPDDDVDTNRKIIYTTLESAEYFEDISLIDGAGLSSYSLNSMQTGKNINLDKSYNIQMGYEVLIYLDSPETFLDLNNKMLNEEIHGFIYNFEPLFPNFRPLFNLTRVMQSNATGFMIITSFIIVCVTMISTIILLNNRKYEIAVLRSVGMKRSNLIISYLIENLVFIWSVTTISLIIAQFITPTFTSNVFTGMQKLISVEMFENLTKVANIKLLFQNVGFVFIGTTIVVMLSLTLAYINIVRFEPLKIFNKQY